MKMKMKMKKRWILTNDTWMYPRGAGAVKVKTQSKKLAALSLNMTGGKPSEGEITYLFLSSARSSSSSSLFLSIFLVIHLKKGEWPSAMEIFPHYLSSDRDSYEN